MIDKTDGRVLTEKARDVLEIMSQDVMERFGKFQVDEYLPELNHRYEANRDDFKGIESYMVFKARDLLLDKEGYLCYSNQDRYEFKPLSFVVGRLKRFGNMR